MHSIVTIPSIDILNSIVTVAAKEVKKTGVFTIPGLCRIKTRTKPATKACTKMIFGKETKVKAKPAKTVVKAFPAAALTHVSKLWMSIQSGRGKNNKLRIVPL